MHERAGSRGRVRMNRLRALWLLGASGALAACGVPPVVGDGAVRVDASGDGSNTGRDGGSMPGPDGGSMPGPDATNEMLDGAMPADTGASPGEDAAMPPIDVSTPPVDGVTPPRDVVVPTDTAMPRPDASVPIDTGVLLDAAPRPDVVSTPDAVSDTGARPDVIAPSDGGGMGGADAGPPPSCSSTLVERTVVTDLSDLTVASCSSFAGISTSTVSCIRIAGAPDGSVRVAYTDRASMVHVLTVDAMGRRTGRELTTMGNDIRAVYVNAAGDTFAWVNRGIVNALVRWAPDGTQRYDNALVGTMGMATAGTRWAHASIRPAALVQSGANTAVYSTVGGNWGAQGIHEGDQLRLVNEAGMIGSGGWDWGCSHSLDLRIAQSTGALAPVCLSDAYPQVGIVLNNRTRLVAAPGWNQGGSISSGYASRMIIPMLGGVIADGAGYYLSFASADGRAARDVAILRFEGTTVAERRWLTMGAAGALAYQVDLMRLGTGMLVYWEWVEGMQTSANLLELDATGAPRGTPLRMLATDAANTLAFRGGEVPAISIPGGDAAFVGNRQGRSGPLRLVRIRACR